MIDGVDIIQTHLLTLRRTSTTTWQICMKLDQNSIGVAQTPFSGWYVEIEPGHRRKGLAQQALIALLASCNDPSQVTARIEADNKPGRMLLQACGFRPDDSNDLRYAGPATDTAAEMRSALLSKAAASYPKELAELHSRLGVPQDYAVDHQLSPVAEATELQHIGEDIFQRPQHLTPAASEAWKAMVAAAASDQVSLKPVSAYRSVAYQAQIIERKLESGQTPETIFSVSAAPGFSEHHSGNAVDLSDGEGEPLVEAFEHSPAFTWLTEHAAEHRFYLSFPRNNRHQLIYEPWHWCFKPATP